MAENVLFVGNLRGNPIKKGMSRRQFLHLGLSLGLSRRRRIAIDPGWALRKNPGSPQRYWLSTSSRLPCTLCRRPGRYSQSWICRWFPSRHTSWRFSHLDNLCLYPNNKELKWFEWCTMFLWMLNMGSENWTLFLYSNYLRFASENLTADRKSAKDKGTSSLILQ